MHVYNSRSTITTMHVYNMTADDITEVVNTTLCKDFNLKRPLAVGVLLWLGNRDRRFLFIKKASYSFGLRESYALKKEFERFQHTSAVERMAFPGARYQTKTGSVPTSDLDPKSLSDLLEYYDGTLGDGDDKHTVAQAKKIAVDLLAALKAKQREKSQQLELSLAACSESSNLRVIAGDLASAGVGFRVVVGTSADAQKLAKARKLFAEVAQEPVTSRILRDGKYVFRPKSAGSAENPKKSCFGDLAEPMDLDACIRYATTTLRIRKEVDAENYRRGNDGLRRKRAASKKATATTMSDLWTLTFDQYCKALKADKSNNLHYVDFAGRKQKLKPDVGQYVNIILQAIMAKKPVSKAILKNTEVSKFLRGVLETYDTPILLDELLADPAQKDEVKRLFGSRKKALERQASRRTAADMLRSFLGGKPTKKATATASTHVKETAELRVLAHNTLKSAGLVMDYEPQINFVGDNVDSPRIVFMADDSEATPSTAQLQVAPSEGRSIGWTCKIFLDRNEVFKTIIHPCKDGIEAVKHMLPETMKRIRAAIK